MRQRPDPAVSAAFGVALEGLNVQRGLLVWVSGDDRGGGFPGEVFWDDRLQAYFGYSF